MVTNSLKYATKISKKKEMNNTNYYICTISGKMSHFFLYETLKFL